ncbi:MAG TPA: adenylate/guanylate cyclase domain-containing protein [Kiloniellales bacterium]|nr:adenylate/guanylate cyclase domain-containing protein [Kiloniellales bacterium]
MPDIQPPASASAISAEVRARADPIVDWLLREERLSAARTVVLLERFAARLLDASVPLVRVSLHIQQLHPQIAARSLVWDAETRRASEADHEHSARNEAGYLRSPVKPIFEGGPEIRRRLEDPECPRDFPILGDLDARGSTDYAIYPLPFSNGRRNALSVATTRPGGFHESDLALIEAVLPAFAAVLELQQLRRTGRELLSTYVGRGTGERIFGGTIRRGDGEVMHAVVWYCDLRGFTETSERLPLDRVIALLNDYFDCVAAPVDARGGEILKFIGDGILAIFPCRSENSALCGAADTALEAAEAALAAIAALNQRREAESDPPLQCGIAIHVGEVMYGNIGAADRLDFTVIGPTVNLVSRMESLCAELDHPIVVSAPISRAAGRRFRPLGRFALRGIAEPQEVFAPEPPDERSNEKAEAVGTVPETHPV